MAGSGGAAGVELVVEQLRQGRGAGPGAGVEEERAAHAPLHPLERARERRQHVHLRSALLQRRPPAA
eukprot:3461117-Pyramimonas_sp.AAC.3